VLAAAAFTARPLLMHERYALLNRTAEVVRQRKAHLIESMVVESGFTVSDAATEVSRAIERLTISGFGREGPKYAIREMTDERLVTITSVL
jgi:acyl-CoA reductase-like NAD-dependent aldehyde dehydrogenase